ncbi:iron-sulfur cluster co-chaperone protein HscB isoform X1 [Mycteria americana]|uniref:iron-sulfur cluster co-chaperone protein HscB isoform X1 n=1 Tax=Mycteria americana TaxID=33587 RepID=UPI003F58E8CE
MQAALRQRLGRVRWALRVSEAAPRPRCVGPGSPAALRCWSCGSPLPGAEGLPRFCPGCRALQPPAPRPDLFRLMDCDRSFRIDAQQLQRRFRSLQRAVHPDRFGRRPPKEQYYSEQHSSLINKAYQTLLNPLSRGLYLLELSGVEPAQETDCDADSVFLTEIMEINEKLAEPKNEDILEEIETLIKVKQEELTKEVTAAFEREYWEGQTLFLIKLTAYSEVSNLNLGDFALQT